MKNSCCPQQVVFRKPADYSKAAVYKCKPADYSKAVVYKCKLADYSKVAVYKCKLADYSKLAVTSVNWQITVNQHFTLVKYFIPGLQLFFS